MIRPHFLWCYGRISSSKQRLGKGEERQVSADWDRFAAAFKFQIHPTFLFDDSKSGWTGANWDADAELGQFAIRAEAAREVRPGDCLGCECWDRLSKLDTRKTLNNVLRILNAGVHLADVRRCRMIHCTEFTTLDLLDLLMTTDRGHEASTTTSWRCLETLGARLEDGREGRLIHVANLPTWIVARPCSADVPGARRIGKLKAERWAILELRADARPTFELLSRLRREGYRGAELVRYLQATNVRPIFGRAWTRIVLSELWKDRRLLGECRLYPRDSKSTSVTRSRFSWIPHYYPALCSEAEFAALAPSQHSHVRGPGGRQATQPNPFKGLLSDPLTGEPWRIASTGHAGKLFSVLTTVGRDSGREKGATVNFEAFRDLFCAELAEITAKDVLGAESGEEELREARLLVEASEREYKGLTIELETNGFEAALAARLRTVGLQLEERRQAYGLALHRLANPLSAAWDAQSALLTGAAIATDKRLYWQAVGARFRETIDRIWLLVIQRGHTRLASVQVDFKEGKPPSHRQMLFLIRRSTNTPTCVRPAIRQSVSVPRDGLPLFPDLRNRVAALTFVEALSSINASLLTNS